MLMWQVQFKKKGGPGTTCHDIIEAGTGTFSNARGGCRWLLAQRTKPAVQAVLNFVASGKRCRVARETDEYSATC